MGVLLESLLYATAGERPGIHDGCCPELLGCQPGSTILHVSVGEGRSILHHQDPLAADGSGVRHGDGRGCLYDVGIGVDLLHVPSDDLQVLRPRRVHFIDDDHIRHPQVGLPGVVGQLISRPVGIHQNDVEIRLAEGEVVVPTIPEDDLRLFLGLLQDCPVVHPSVYHNPAVHVGLILLPLLDGAFMPVQVLEGGEPLDRLLLQVAVRHGVADHDDPSAPGLQQGSHPPGSLTLPRPRSDGADGYDRDLGLQHGLLWCKQDKVRAASICDG